MFYVFKACQKLGIDDPTFWLNNVSPLLSDQWIAFELALEDAEAEDPAEAFSKLQSKYD